MIRNKRTTFAACIDTDSALTNRNTVPRLAGSIVDDTSPTGRAVQASCPRPATATQRRDSESPSGGITEHRGHSFQQNVDGRMA